MTRLIIGLTGAARAGKDTAATTLVEDGFIRDALADDLRAAALALNPWIPQETGRLERLQEVVDRLGWDEAKAIPEVRRTLQRMGSEAGWMMHGKRLWIDRVDARIAATDADVVVTDVRFEAEAKWIRSLGGRVVHLVRPEHPDALVGENAAHSSEAGTGIVPDALLVNDASLGSLRANVREMVRQLRAVGPGGHLAEPLVL